MSIWSLLLQIYLVSSPIAHAQSSSKPCAILLHGLARTSKSMSSLKSYLVAEDFIVVNKSYPSQKHKIEKLSKYVGSAISDCVQKSQGKIYLVTHSMGAILVRHYLQNTSNKPNTDKIKAIVMLSPPNHGSEIVDAFKSHRWFKWYNGPAGAQLGTDPSSFPNRLKPIKFPVGVLTGNVSSDPWFSYLFSSPNDGKVSVASARLKEMKDFLIVARGHTFIMNSPEVHHQIKYFFTNLKFEKND